MTQAPDFDPKALRLAVEQAADPELELDFRAMFGGIMGYANSRPFASMSNRGLALKLGKHARDRLLALPGARPLRYEPDDPPSKTYTLVPDAMTRDSAALAPWIKESAAFVVTLVVRRSRGK